MPLEAPFSEADARIAIRRSICWSDALRLLGYEPKGHNIRTLQRWARIWDIDTSHFDPHIGRKVPRPSHAQLLADLKTTSFRAVGRKYGVSDNAIRKWLKWYEHQQEREATEADRAEDHDPPRQQEPAA